MPRPEPRAVFRRALPAVVLAAAMTPVTAQLRVAAWNISNYNGGRVADIQTVVYGAFESRRMAPDVILGLEFISAAALEQFRSALNTAPGSPGDWLAAPFIDGPDTDGVCLYRAAKADLLAVVIAAPSNGTVNDQPRNTYRYDLRLKNYSSERATISLYATHMKAGSTTTDQARRQIEAQRVRDNAAALPAGRHFLIGGDFNIQSSSQQAYQTLVGPGLSPLGRFLDPIVTPGSWNNNAAFSIVHTQDPIGAGGMDDRHDQILVSESLADGEGFDYLAAFPLVPYSVTTWNDPNHSYRAWGNDGASFNASLNVATNAMVGPAIAQSIINCAVGGGHLPVFLDLRVPPRAAATQTLAFGAVVQGRPASRTLQVVNSGDSALWGAAGIATLTYSLAAPVGFTAQPGVFTAAPGAPANAHDIALDSNAPLGPLNATLTVSSNDPETPSIPVALTARIVPRGDANLDGRVDFADLNLVLSDFGAVAGPGQSFPGDVNFDGRVDFADLNLVLGNFGVSS